MLPILTIEYIENQAFPHTFRSSLLTSIYSICLLIVERSQHRTIDYFLSDLLVVVMNFTAAQFQFEIKSTGQLPLCFIRILGTYILSSASEKQGCFNAQAADILSSGCFCSIFLSKSTSIRLSLSNSTPVRTISHSRFMAIISVAFLPINRCLLKIMQKKMQPTLKMSLIGWDFVDRSFMLMIQGATYPGVPHLTNRQLGSSATVASPKSMMIGYFARMILSGFKSLWITFLLPSSTSPCRIPMFVQQQGTQVRLQLPFMMNFLQLQEYLERLLNLLQIGLPGVRLKVPSMYSKAKQIEFQDQQTPYIFIKFGWLNIFVIFISFIIASLPQNQIETYLNIQAISLPLSCENVMHLPKALIATFFWSFSQTPKQTVAKFPLPSLFQALNRSWKLNWFITFRNYSSHLSKSFTLSEQNSCDSMNWLEMNLIPKGIPKDLLSGQHLGRKIWKIVSKDIRKPFLSCLLSGRQQKTHFEVRTKTTGMVLALFEFGCGEFACVALLEFTLWPLPAEDPPAVFSLRVSFCGAILKLLLRMGLVDIGYSQSSKRGLFSESMLLLFLQINGLASYQFCEIQFDRSLQALWILCPIILIGSFNKRLKSRRGSCHNSLN